MGAQKQLGVSDREFAQNYLKIYTESTWSKLRGGTYKAKDLSKAFGELKSALTSIRRRIVRQLKSTQGGRYHELDQFAAMARAVRDCLEKKGENRLIIYVAPTGGGKSRFIAELDSRESVTSLRASEAWFSSYYHASLDIIAALEGSGKYGSAGESRRAMLDLMRGRNQVIAIDEANYFGPRSINMVKDLLNETEWTVLLCMTREHWDKMRRHWAAWSQLQRRIHTVFFHSPLNSDDAAQFLADAGLNGDSKKAARALADAANEFGAYDFVCRVIERLDEAGNHGHPTMADVEAAIAFVKVQLGRIS